MYYKTSFEFWLKQPTNKDLLDYKTIEKNMLKKMSLLINSYQNSKDEKLQKILADNLHLSKLNHHFKLGYYGLSDKIICQISDCTTYYIGDLHSDAMSLDTIIKEINPYTEACHLIFLGDYVDRGRSHLELLDKLWALKLDLPNKITLLRGNHDGGYFLDDDTIQLPYRLSKKDDKNDYFPLYLQALVHNKKLSKKFIEKYFFLCNAYPYLIFTHKCNKWYMGVHGGIPRPWNNNCPYDYIPSLGALELESSVDVYKVPLLNNMLWSDPSQGNLGSISDKRRFNTYRRHFEAFSSRFGITTLIRGHEVVESGHLAIYDKGVHTIFSSGYGSKDSAYHQEVKSPKILKLSSNDLEEVELHYKSDSL